MTQITVAAHAKINLTLDILGRRPDGYHNVEMVMQSVSLHDVITLSRASGGGITLGSDSSDVPPGPENLAVRAAALFFETTGIANSGVHIALHKKIPVAAGLAGGSADAAGTLKALGALFAPELALEDLLQMGAKLGADIPFCLAGSTRLARGVGELLSPLCPMPPCFIVLAKPLRGVSTAGAYARFDETGASARPDAGRMARALRNGNLMEVAENLCNVFEEVMAIPEVEDIKAKMLASGALGACMSGSGPSVYGIFGEEKKAESCRSALCLLPGLGEVFVCRPALRGCEVVAAS